MRSAPRRRGDVEQLEAVIARRWPHLATRFFVVTGGPTCVRDIAYLSKARQPPLYKPFGIAELLGRVRALSEAA